jgi:hypothetical protein
MVMRGLNSMQIKFSLTLVQQVLEVCVLLKVDFCNFCGLCCMFIIFLLFITFKAKEEELKACQKRRDSVEKELTELRFAIAQAKKGSGFLAKKLKAYEGIVAEQGNGIMKLTSAIHDTDMNNYELKDLAFSMGEEMSFKAQYNTGECGASD